MQYKSKFNRLVKAGIAAGLTVAASIQQAHAALDASIGTGITAVVTDATSVSALVLPAVVTIMGLGIVIKLVKRFGNKL